jgi:prolyl oligopeptidase
MHRSRRIFAGLLALALVSTAFAGPISYPPAKKGDVVDTYHGVQVADPFRWLEDPDSPETRAWIDAENKVTFGFLDQIPQRDKIRERLTKLWDYERFGTPMKMGGQYFYLRNDGLQNQSVLFVTKSAAEPGKVLIDPNTFSSDGTVALAATAVTEDGKYIAYAKSDGGSDWQTWYVRDIATGQDLPDTIEWSKFSGASWLKDGSGFFYGRFDAPPDGNKLQSVNEFNKVYFHKLGTPQSADPLVYERKDHKDWGFGADVTDDGKYLIIAVTEGTDRRNLLFYKDLATPDAKVVELIPHLEAEYEFIDNDGPVFWIKTDLNAPLGRIVAIDTRSPEKTKWKELVPENKETLAGAGVVNDKFILSYLKDARSAVRLHDLTGKLIEEIPLPGLGSAGGFGGRRDYTETFYSYTDYSTPPTIYRYDFTTRKSSVYKQPKVDFQPAEYETKQIFYTSKDGTRVPMFITHKKGIKLDGNNPTILYGYGGFNQAMTPYFSVSNLVWMEMGGVYAVANLRGGSEYGREWHEAGCKLKRQNVFDDFIAAGEWLVANKYTQPSKLASFGGSNGGLLVAATMVQRPDLFGAACPAVGVLDMLRFNKFTIGWAWMSDYGSPEIKDEFDCLYKYSPLHNLKKGTKYPAVFMTTADHDDRVVPAHSFKFAAALQEAQGGDAPVLIRIETRAGHGAGKPTKKIIEEQADRFGFLVRVLGMAPESSDAPKTSTNPT